MKRNYTLEINLPAKVSDELSDQDLQEIKKHLNQYICEKFDICNIDTKIVTKITNN